MSDPRARLAQSAKARLVSLAHAEGRNPNLLLSRFALERFLYRLSCSPYREQFVVKGAMMLLVWLGDTARPTRDIDLLGLGDIAPDQLTQVFQEVCEQKTEPDGLRFDSSTVAVRPIRRAVPDGGQRITLVGFLGPARLRVQIDVGLGDAVVPPPEWMDYPSLLDFDHPRLRGYRPETAIAEKLHAIVSLGFVTSRLRDYYDIHRLATEMEFDGRTLISSARATFGRRGLKVLDAMPPALTRTFAVAADKQKQWEAFLRRSQLSPIEGGLERVVSDVATFLVPVLTAIRGEPIELGTWKPGGPWQRP